MNSDSLNHNQIDVIKSAIGRSGSYYKKLIARMEEVAFDRDDGLRQDVEQIFKQIDRLVLRLHYLKCKHQVGGNPFRHRK